MPAIGLRRVAALLLAVVLLGASQAAAAPERPAAGRSIGATVLEALTSWLGALGTPVSPSTSREPVWAAVRSGAAPDRAPQAASEVPTADPELGSGADPDG